MTIAEECKHEPYAEWSGHESLHLMGFAKYRLLKCTKPRSVLVETTSGAWYAATWNPSDKFFEYHRGQYYGDVLKLDEVLRVFQLPK